MGSLDFKTSWKMFIQRGEYVAGSIYVTSVWFSFLLVGHETKEFYQISIIMGISSPCGQTNGSLTSALALDHLHLLGWLWLS